MTAFIIATGAAASNIEVIMFFTFWGLRALKKKTLTGKSFMGKMMGIMERGDIGKATPSKYNFGGLGRRLFGKMMKRKNVPTLPELRHMAIELGVKLYGCQMSMDVLEIPREKMIGVAFFIEQAQESDMQFFI